MKKTGAHFKVSALAGAAALSLLALPIATPNASAQPPTKMYGPTKPVPCPPVATGTTVYSGAQFKTLMPQNHEKVIIYVMQQKLLDGMAGHNFLRFVYFDVNDMPYALDFNGYATRVCNGSISAVGLPWSHNLLMYAYNRGVGGALDHQLNSVALKVGEYSQAEAAPIFLRVMAAGMAMNGPDGKGFDYWGLGIPGHTPNSNAALNTLMRYAFGKNKYQPSGYWAPGGDTNLMDDKMKAAADSLVELAQQGLSDRVGLRDILKSQQYNNDFYRMKKLALPYSWQDWADMANDMTAPGVTLAQMSPRDIHLERLKPSDTVMLAIK